MAPRTLCSLAAACLLLGLTACERAEIQNYKVAKQERKAPEPQMPSDHPQVPGELPPGHPPMASQGLPDGHPPVNSQAIPAGSAAPASAQAPTPNPGDLTWTAPATWQTKSLGAMRRGSYAIPTESGELDLSVFVFPGAAGGTLDNINRWRGQVGMPPITEAALVDETYPIKSESGVEVLVVDIKGSGGDAILGAIVVQGPQSWFFKLKGPAAGVQARKTEFTTFLKTVHVR